MYTLFVCLCLAQPSDDLDRLRDQVVATRQELKWRDVAWLPTLGEGLRRARKDDRPVLLYAMNGHPLGCT